jgi:hypothetical protein
MVFGQEELRAVPDSVMTYWRPGFARPPIGIWIRTGLLSAALACSGCASWLGAATLPVISVGPGATAHLHFVQRLPLPWTYWFMSGSSLAGEDPKTAAEGNLVVAGSSDKWRWQATGTIDDFPPTNEGRCEVASTFAPAPPATLDCAMTRLKQFSEAALGQAPGLDLIVDYIPNNQAARLTWIRFSLSAIPLHFAVNGAPYRDDAERRRKLVLMSSTVAHELLHVYAETGYGPEHENQLAEETAAYAFEACARLAIGGRQFAIAPRKGALTGLEADSSSDISWQASNNLDKLVAAALPKRDGEPTEQQRAEAVLSVCRSIFPGLAAT